MDVEHHSRTNSGGERGVSDLQNVLGNPGELDLHLLLFKICDPKVCGT